jgi:glutamine amidotransferase
MLTIVNYGLGNIRAFSNIYRRLGVPFRIASTVEDLAGATRLVLPGVGAFDWAMRRLEASGMRARLDQMAVYEQIPVLGVCVGMQIMARRSDEGSLPGLGWLAAEVRRFNTSIPETRLPHMGWNDAWPQVESGLFQNIETPRFYFLHSFHVVPDSANAILTISEYAETFTSSIHCGHIFGVQFHPEKSHHWGVQLLRNFAEL